MSITNVPTEPREHFYGDRSSIWAIFAGRISYMPAVKHMTTICGIYDNPIYFERICVHYAYKCMGTGFFKVLKVPVMVFCRFA